MGIGSAGTTLIVLRGNSGSGKPTIARALRDARGGGLAWVFQDLVRRTILQERDVPGGANIGLISQITRYRSRDLLDAVRARVITETSDLAQTVSLIRTETGLAARCARLSGDSAGLVAG